LNSRRRIPTTSCSVDEEADNVLLVGAWTYRASRTEGGHPDVDLLAWPTHAEAGTHTSANDARHLDVSAPFARALGAARVPRACRHRNSAGGHRGDGVLEHKTRAMPAYYGLCRASEAFLADGRRRGEWSAIQESEPSKPSSTLALSKNAESPAPGGRACPADSRWQDLQKGPSVTRNIAVGRPCVCESES